MTSTAGGDQGKSGAGDNGAPLYARPTYEDFRIDAPGAVLSCRLFRPPVCLYKVAFIITHPSAILGGCQLIVTSLARELAARGMFACTYDSRGAGRSTGVPSVGGASETTDMVLVANTVMSFLSEYSCHCILVGSSLGAAVAGAAVPQLPSCVGFVGIGFPMGRLAKLVTKPHIAALSTSPLPKLFVQGENDSVTTPEQLRAHARKMLGSHNTLAVFPNAGHMSLEDDAMAPQIIEAVLMFVLREIAGIPNASAPQASQVAAMALAAHEAEITEGSVCFSTPTPPEGVYSTSSTNPFVATAHLHKQGAKVVARRPSLPPNAAVSSPLSPGSPAATPTRPPLTPGLVVASRSPTPPPPPPPPPDAGSRTGTPPPPPHPDDDGDGDAPPPPPPDGPAEGGDGVFAGGPSLMHIPPPPPDGGVGGVSDDDVDPYAEVSDAEPAELQAMSPTSPPPQDPLTSPLGVFVIGQCSADAEVGGGGGGVSPNAGEGGDVDARRPPSGAPSIRGKVVPLSRLTPCVRPASLVGAGLSSVDVGGGIQEAGGVVAGCEALPPGPKREGGAVGLG